MLKGITQETIRLAREALVKAGFPVDLIKADTFAIGAQTPTQGLQAYDLRAPSRKLYPVLTPLRNRIPRVDGVGSAVNWKAVTAIDTAKTYGGVPEGSRATPIGVTVVDRSQAFKTIGKEGSVTYEQQHAGRTFEDVVALNTVITLQATMIEEEQLIIGGNATLALGTTPTPSLSASGTGTTLTNVAHTVRCVALTLPAYLRAKVQAGFGVPMTITHTDPVDGTTRTFGGGSAKISAAATVTPTANQHVFAKVAPVRGAVAYAWFIGTADGASCRLAAITTINSVDLTAVPAAITPKQYFGATAADFTTNDTDNSTNSLVFDGAITYGMDPALGAIYLALADGTLGTGSGLTADGAAGINEWDTILQQMWNASNCGPSKVLVNGQDCKRATQRVVGGGGSALFRFVVDRDGAGVDPRNVQITAGAKLGDYLNKFTGQLIPVEVHPHVPPGTQLFWSDTIPYPLSEVPSVYEMVTRQEYYDIPWPARTRRYEHGVYVEETLVCNAPFATGVLTNCGDV